MNEVRTQFDLFTRFRQGSRSVDEWYNAVQAQVNFTEYPRETATILHHDIFWFFLHDEEFVSKTINDCNVHLEKFPASKVRQLTQRMESLKATVFHIKQVAGDPESVQINPMRHQHTELSSEKHREKNPFVKSKQPSHKNLCNENPQVSSHHKKIFDPKNAHKDKERCSMYGDSTCGRLSVLCREIPM